MRKILFSMIMSLSVVISIGQNPNKPCNDNDQNELNKSKINSSKAVGDVLWEEDFDAAEWLQYSGGMKPGWRVVDNNGEDFVWIWAQHGPRGRWTSPDNDNDTYVPKEEQSGDTVILNRLKEIPGNTITNGFIMLESDYYNTLPNGDMVADSNIVAMDSYIQVDHIDLSDAPGAFLQFNQDYRWCCSSFDRLSVFVSWDWDENSDAAHWVEFIVNEDYFVSSTYPHVNSQKVIDISSVAAGQSNVTIRWHKINATHYYWLIDDVKIVEPNYNDMFAFRAWWDYGDEYVYDEGFDPDEDFYGGYAMIPETQVDTFVAFRGAVYNNGIFTQINVRYNVVIEKDGVNVYNETSEGITIESKAFDTLKVTIPFVPETKGLYQVSSSVIMDSIDDNPSNNHIYYEFYITDSVFSRTYYREDYDNQCSTRDWADGGNDGDNLGITYDFEKSAFASSVSTYIQANEDNITDIQAGSYQLIARLYEYYVDGNISLTPKVSSLSYTLLERDLDSWITLPFVGNIEDLQLEPGRYIAALEFYSGGQDYRFYIGGDDELLQPWYAYRGILGGGDWGRLSGTLPIIHLNIKDPNAQFIVTFNVDMSGTNEFTAGTDKVYISGSFAEWVIAGTDVNLEMTDNDEDGVYTVSVEMAIGDYEYKYYINNVDGAEVVDNRIVTVTGNMRVNDDFSINIDEINIRDITIYPNPSNGQLKITNAEGSDIEIMNILGEIIFKANNIGNYESVNLNTPKSGLYFVILRNEKQTITKALEIIH